MKSRPCRSISGWLFQQQISDQINELLPTPRNPHPPPRLFIRVDRREAKVRTNRMGVIIDRYDASKAALCSEIKICSMKLHFAARS